MPERSYLVCATPRSGSTLLCHLLAQTGIAGRPEEYFEALRHSGVPRRPHEYFDPERHANIIERLAFRELPDGTRHRPNPLWQPDSYDRYLAWALEQGTTPNGVFGAKLMWGYLGDFADLLRGIEGNAGRTVPDLLARSVPDLHYVQITRDDKVRQAVSLWKAVQTQAWRRDAARSSPRRPSRPCAACWSTWACPCPPTSRSRRPPCACRPTTAPGTGSGGSTSTVAALEGPAVAV